MIWPDCNTCKTPLPNCSCVTSKPPMPVTNTRTIAPYPSGPNAAFNLPPSRAWYSYWGWTGPQQDTQPDAKPIEHDADRFPHECPKCGASAWVGAGPIEHEYPTECR